MVQTTHEVLLDDDVDVDVSGDVVSSWQGPPGLGEVVGHEDKHGSDQDDRDGDVGLRPSVVVVEPEILEPPPSLQAGKRQRPVQPGVSCECVRACVVQWSGWEGEKG